MNNRTQKYGLVKNAILLISLTNVIAYSGLLLASSPITDLITSTTPATPSTYTAGGNTYNWGSIGVGNGVDVHLDGFNLGANSYFPVSLANSVTIRRVDNGNVSGAPCGIFAEKSSNFNLTTTYPEDSVGNGSCDMEGMIGGDIISRGGLDVFDNTNSSKAKNIERVDFIFTNGITAPADALDLDEAGHVVTEKSGNNPVQIAVILTLNGAGQPLTYGPLITVDKSSNSPDVAYGLYNSIPKTSFDFLTNTQQAEPRGFPTRDGGSNEWLGSAFVTLDHLGVMAGQTYFGFSYFAADVDAATHTLSDPSTFPDDTSNNDGDADMYGGTSGYFQLAALIDTDNDGIPNSIDIDDDNDGIPDTVEQATAINGGDTDGDGVLDELDLDADGDGISDLVESGVSVADVVTLDSDNNGAIDPAINVGTNGLANLIEDVDTPAAVITYNGGSPLDTDGDGRFDFQDLDSDNDGLHDLFESGLDPAVFDSNNDGVVDDNGVDADSDGVSDSLDANDAAFGGINTDPVDTDNDGAADFRNLDSDNDGIHDLVEAGVVDPALVDTDNDGVLDNPLVDADGDGIPDSGDTNDGVYGDPQTDVARDTDGDTVPDYQDLDSDNDGIHDLTESGVVDPALVDIDNDGVLDNPLVDADGDGIPDSGDTNDGVYGDPQIDAVRDTDGDTVPDYRDLDSDNDSINDILESGNGAADTDGDGVADNPTTDTDGDGVPDSIDTNVNAFGDPDAALLPDADADGTPDVRETDSNNDGTNDIVDNGFGGLDTNGDGVIDVATDLDGDGIPDVTDGSNGFGGGSDLGLPDLDLDGIADINDIDDDNDGIPDTVEQATAINGGDTDGDGIPDERDLDADGDGISDIVESGLTPAQIAIFDADNDGVIDAAVPVGVNGLADAIETDDTTVALLDQDGDGNANGPVDTDNDSHPDFQDLDADNDGIHDLIEVGGLHPDPLVIDADNNGVIDDNGTDADQDGIPDSIDTNDALLGGLSNSPVDTDSDNVANFRDIDSDNDGITDLYESGIFPDATVVDADNDGVLDNPTTDADGDGVPDSGDSNDSSYGDPQGAGVVDTDGDNVPDYLDLDSDNDSIPDVTEAGNQDDDNDGLLDPGGTVTFPPTNTDGLDNPDHLDLDSNNDGINDIEDTENGGFDTDGDGKVDGSDDADEDGVLDAVDGEPGVFGIAVNSDERLETAVNGIGSFGPMSLFMMLLLLSTRLLRSGLANFLLQKNKLAAILSTLLMLTTFSATAHSGRNDCGRQSTLSSDTSEDFNKCFYGGVGYLIATHVHPRGEAQTWKTSDHTDAGYNIYLGWHFKPRWFGELNYADIGDAGLRNAALEEGEISYKIPSLHIGYWFLKPERRFNVYVKAGLSAISNNETPSVIPFEKQNSVNLTGGVGVQWRSQTSGLFARLAADFYDRDANSVGINVGYYFGGSHKHKGKQKTKNIHTRVTPLMLGQVDNADADADTDGDGVTNERDLCPNTVGVAVDVNGCVIPDIAVSPEFSLRGVNFRTNSALLTPESQSILDNAAAKLMSVPHINIGVQAHTDNLGDADYNEDLSHRRAVAVRDYLEQKGVSGDRMEIGGYGEGQPRGTNNTRIGRWLNRRVELHIID